jgi:hypothetical protein
MDSGGAAITQMLLGKDVDRDKVMFDFMYGTGFGTAIGETERAIRYGPWLNQNKGWKGKALNFAFALAFKKLKNPVYIGLQSKYFKQDEKNFALAVREYMGNALNLNLEDFTDTEVIDAYKASLRMSDEQITELSEEIEMHIIESLDLSSVTEDQAS